MKKLILTILTAILCVACTKIPKTSNDVQREQQERILGDLTSQTGMPAIKNARERKLLKDIFELRDQDGLVTFTYTFSELSGQLKFFCNSIGYGIPYATQFTNPEAYQRVSTSGGGWTYMTLPQADPNGLFSPAGADGTWIMCADEKGNAKPVFVEPRIIVSPFRLPTL